MLASLGNATARKGVGGLGGVSKKYGAKTMSGNFRVGEDKGDYGRDL